MTDSSRRLAINAEWFGRLRWVAAAGQLATIAFVVGPLGISLPVGPLLLLVAVTLITNAMFSWWRRSRKRPTSRSVWHAVLGGLMLLDLVVLTAMLGLTGGPTNPFVVFYFVNLALSGVVLPAAWAWALSALAIASVGLLSVAHTPIAMLQDPARLQSYLTWSESGGGAPPPATLGAWIAFAASATVIVNFTTRLTSELRASDRLLRRAESERARSEKLDALGTLAAGAAHELATPLSTIAVAVTETHRALADADAPPRVVDDLALVRREVDRCRTILDRMATDSGQPAAGPPERLRADRLLADVLNDLPGASRVDLDWAEGAESLQLLAPRVAVAQAVRAVVQNALDATDAEDPSGRVRVKVDQLAETLRLKVVDRGVGMDAAALARAGEPFFTTKAPGHGMGLGLFLARSVVERLGGSLRLESPSTGGAIATLVLPLVRSAPS